MIKGKPLVSLLCLTYNHEGYIEETLDSFLMQKTDFEFEIIVNDDASTDKTTDILKDYEKRHPDMIRLVLQTENQFSKGNPALLITFLLPLVRGKYIAICDGDDFFTNQNKLQMQVNFLEQNPEYTVCFHPTRILTQDVSDKNVYWPVFDYTRNFDTIELLRENFIPSNSVMYRTLNYKDISRNSVMPTDWYLHLYHTRYGKIGFIDEVMSAYRQHDQGIWRQADTNPKELFRRNYKFMLNFSIAVVELFGADPKYEHALYKGLNSFLKKDVTFELNKAHESAQSDHIEIERLEQKLRKQSCEQKLLILDKERQIQEKNGEIALMRASIFWKMRNWYLSVKIFPKNVAGLIRNWVSYVEQAIIAFGRENFTESHKVFLRSFLRQKHRVEFIESSYKLWTGPLITVVIPYFNRGYVIDETIESILSQTFQNFEIIVVNDGSDAENSKKLENFHHEKITILKQKNQGVSRARNNGIKNAKGKYILCLDSDDKIHKTYLEKALIIMEQNPGVGIVYPDTQRFGSETDIIKSMEFNPLVLIQSNYISTASIFRKKLWQDAGGYKDELGYEDWEFWISMVEKGAYGKYIPEALFCYRVVEGQSKFSDDQENHNDHIKKIEELHPMYAIKIQNYHDQWTKRRYRLEGNPMCNIYKPAKNENAKPAVLIALPWMTFGGAERVVLNLCSELCDSYDFSFVTGLKSDNEWEEKFQEISDKIYHLPNLCGDENYYSFLRGYIENHDIKIIHIVHNSSFFKFLPQLKQDFPSIKIISTVFNTVAHFDAGLEMLSYIDVYTTDNSVVRNTFDARLKKGVSKEMRIIHNGIDNAQQFNRDLYDRSSQREELSLKNDDLAVFFIGRLSQEKNPDIFVEAAVKVLKQEDNIRFFIVGDGPMKNLLEKQIGKNENIEVLGYEQNVAKYLSSADVFVLPSKTEGFPLSNIEAMAMGAVVVASDVGGVADAIRDTDNGFLVKPSSVNEIVNALLYINSHREIIAKITEQAHADVDNNFSISIMSNKYRELYKQVL